MGGFVGKGEELKKGALQARGCGIKNSGIWRCVEKIGGEDRFGKG